MNLRVGLTYDLQPDNASTDHWAEWDQPATIATIDQGLRTLGHTARRIGTAQQLLQQLDGIRRDCDLIFNLAEGAAGRTREAWVPTLCEMTGLPCVGSPPQALAMALDKWMTKRLWQAEGLPVPWGISVTDAAALDAAERLPFPLIVKPRCEGSGMGIDAEAIVHDRASLRRRVAWAIERYREPAMVEAFIRGGELTVCLLGDPLQALTPVQRHIDPLTTLSCHIVQRGAFDATTPWELPIEVTPALEARLQRLALSAATALGCRDVARVDVRVTPDGEPSLLEINPLPSLDRDGTFALLAELLGWGFSGLLQRIIEPAIRRTTDIRHRTSVNDLTDVRSPLSDVPFQR